MDGREIIVKQVEFDSPEFVTEFNFQLDIFQNY